MWPQGPGFICDHLDPLACRCDNIYFHNHLFQHLFSQPPPFLHFPTFSNIHFYNHLLFYISPPFPTFIFTSTSFSTFSLLFHPQLSHCRSGGRKVASTGSNRFLKHLKFHSGDPPDYPVDLDDPDDNPVDPAAMMIPI